MSEFVQANCDQACLPQPDLRDWLPTGDLAHFVVETVELRERLRGRRRPGYKG